MRQDKIYVLTQPRPIAAFCRFSLWHSGGVTKTTSNSLIRAKFGASAKGKMILDSLETLTGNDLRLRNGAYRVAYRRGTSIAIVNDHHPHFGGLETACVICRTKPR
jgi:hypothetical protein